MIPLNFWGGVAIMSLSLPVFWWLLRRVFPSGENIIYIGGVIASLLVFAAVLRIIWVSVSIDALLLHDPANYPIGMEIYGIKWEKRFAALVVSLPNNSESDLTNLDVYLWTDAQIAGAGIAPGINVCSAESWFPGFIAGQSFTVTGMEQSPLSIPILKTNKGSSNVYRLRCERLSAESQIQVIFPIIDDVLSSTKPQPRWAKLWISVVAGYRPTSWSVEKCFVNECADIPAVLYGRHPSFWSLFLFASTTRMLLPP